MKGEGLSGRENSKHTEPKVGRRMLCSRSQKASTFREKEDREKGKSGKSRPVRYKDGSGCGIIESCRVC